MRLLIAAGQAANSAEDLLAVEDALASFPADHILVGLRTAERSGWQERGLLDELQRFGLPVTVFTLPPE